MPTSIKFLRADHGDAILLQHKQSDEIFTILIDGGPSTAFRNNSRRIDGSLKRELDTLTSSNTSIDLLILSHIDSDHIGGLLEGFKSPSYLPILVKKVWFNSATSIAKRLEQEIKQDHYIHERFDGDLRTSIAEGNTFEEFVKGNEIWDEELISISYNANLPLGIKITILSPSFSELDKLLNKWKRYRAETDLSTSSCSYDYGSSYSELLETDQFIEDTSVTNGSSISFLLEISGRKMLLLADAHASTVTESLRNLGYSEKHPLDCDFMKVSHHGSKGNTSIELLKIIRTKKFIITTDGSAHCLPNKKTLARIHDGHPNSAILFNYPELIEKIYSPQEVLELGNLVGSIEEGIYFAD